MGGFNVLVFLKKALFCSVCFKRRPFTLFLGYTVTVYSIMMTFSSFFYLYDGLTCLFPLLYNIYDLFVMRAAINVYHAMATNPDGPRRVACGLDQLQYVRTATPFLCKKDKFFKYNKNINELSSIGILMWFLVQYKYLCSK